MRCTLARAYRADGGNWGGLCPYATATLNYYSLGCQRAGAVENGAIILAFGAPAYISGLGWGTYLPGTIPSPETFIALNDIKSRAMEFAAGFWDCRNTGSYARIIIGTSNSGGQVNNGHGAQWAAMVNEVQDWITSPPSYGGFMAAHGGSDIEMGFNSYATSVGWVQSYDSANQRNLYDFGDAAGCPASQSGNLTGQTPTALSCQNGWNQAGVAYVSWGNPAAYPLPEIYTEGSFYSAQAIQWARIASQYHQYYGGSAWMIISGVLTQCGACDYNGGASACPSIYNSPAQGYSQLWNALNYLDWGYVAHTPAWLSDTNWQP